MLWVCLRSGAGMIVGHVPRERSCVLSHFLSHDGEERCEVTNRGRHSPLNLCWEDWKYHVYVHVPRLCWRMRSTCINVATIRGRLLLCSACTTCRVYSRAATIGRAAFIRGNMVCDKRDLLEGSHTNTHGQHCTCTGTIQCTTIHVETEATCSCIHVHVCT